MGGSDEVKICEQLGANGMYGMSLYFACPSPDAAFASRVCHVAAKEEVDYFFAENGLVAYQEGQPLAVQSLKTWLGEDQLKELINFVLHYIADLDIPIKRGTFVEFRNGMLNVCPIGRNCSQAERDEFGRYDGETGVRSASLQLAHVLRVTSQCALSCLLYKISCHMPCRNSVATCHVQLQAEICDHLEGEI